MTSREAPDPIAHLDFMPDLHEAEVSTEYFWTPGVVAAIGDYIDKQDIGAWRDQAVLGLLKYGAYLDNLLHANVALQFVNAFGDDSAFRPSRELDEGRNVDERDESCTYTTQYIYDDTGIHTIETYQDRHQCYRETAFRQLIALGHQFLYVYWSGGHLYGIDGEDTFTITIDEAH